ncbi:MAG: sensor histidine kinase N-terminal domain-containing protein [Lautropia sp.]|nr:sensor histidine kinase N-terminal domain-containing protein [Lautropia sp.]
MTSARAGKSLKISLLWWMLPALLVGTAVGMWRSGEVLQQQAESAYDRSLAGALRAIDLNVSTETGGLSLAMPYQLMEFFRMTASGRVYYRVMTEDGLAEIGHAALPMPDLLPPTDQLSFYYGRYFDEELIRVAILVRELSPPLRVHGEKGSGSNRVIIQVAESLEDRERDMHGLLMDVVLRDLMLLVLLVLAVSAGVVLALRPLVRLRDEVVSRPEDDLRPISVNGIPAEVVPLVQGINGHMARFLRHAQTQRQFLDDASHQLRTPLALLRTKVEYALRESDPAEMRAALAAMRSGLDRAERVTNQMLALARANDARMGGAGVQHEHFDLCALLDESVRLLWSAARQKRLDYGMELPSEPVLIQGGRLLLQEAMLNLLDNAIKYTPEGGSVLTTLTRRGDEVVLAVLDSGPGMSAEDIALAGVRFRRGEAGKGSAGAGLGLAIVSAIVTAHQGRMRLVGHGGVVGGIQATESIGDVDEPRQRGNVEAARQHPAADAQRMGLRVELVFSLTKRGVS